MVSDYRMRTLFSGKPGNKPVWIKSTLLEKQLPGTYHYTVYGALGRLLISIKESGKFLLLGFGLMIFPGEALFYGLFFLLFVPYEIYVCWRMRTISAAVAGQCPACMNLLHIELSRDDYPTFWKYCATCGAALEIRHAG